MEWLDGIFEVFKIKIIPISVTAGLLLIYVVGRSLSLRFIKRHAEKNKLSKGRELYARKLISLLLLLLFLTIIGASWEISLKGLSLYFASIFTVVGVALFATWSILSNLTASIILFFFFPYRVGSEIRIIDGENSQEGRILDITLFYIEIETADKKVVAYPNNLAVTKPIVHG